MLNRQLPAAKTGLGILGAVHPAVQLNAAERKVGVLAAHDLVVLQVTLTEGQKHNVSFVLFLFFFFFFFFLEDPTV